MTAPSFGPSGRRSMACKPRAYERTESFGKPARGGALKSDYVARSFPKVHYSAEEVWDGPWQRNRLSPRVPKMLNRLALDYGDPLRTNWNSVLAATVSRRWTTACRLRVAGKRRAGPLTDKPALVFRRVGTKPAIKIGDGTRQFVAAQRAFPHRRDPPAALPQGIPVSAVTVDVRCELLGPEGLVRRRGRAPVAARMPVPEAAVDEDGCTVPRKDEVRPPGQSPVVQTESVTEPVEGAAQPKLRPGVRRTDAGHHPRARRRVDDVSHGHACQSARKLIEDDGRVQGA